MTQDRKHRWLLFMAQLPAEPSSARVAMWRSLKSAGATSFLTGTWVLPMNEHHGRMLVQLEDTVRDKGGAAAVFLGSDIDGVTSNVLVERFRTDRAREYDEFEDRAGGLINEIAKETAASKFTFAELEEIEGDLEKLSLWLGRIHARDFFPNERFARATDLLATCGEAARGFAETTYDREGAAKDPSD